MAHILFFLAMVGTLVEVALYFEVVGHPGFQNERSSDIWLYWRVLNLCWWLIRVEFICHPILNDCCIKLLIHVNNSVSGYVEFEPWPFLAQINTWQYMHYFGSGILLGPEAIMWHICFVLPNWGGFPELWSFFQLLLDDYPWYIKNNI